MADNKTYYYLKLKEHFFESDELLIIESMQKGYIYSNILLKLYLRSLKDDGRLMLSENIPFDVELISKITRHSKKNVEKALEIFTEFKLIEVLDSGAIYMLNIQELIGNSTTEADRKRRQRKRIEDEKVGQMSRRLSTKRPPEKEIEKEIEKEKERESEEEKGAPARTGKAPYGKFKNVFLTEEEHRELKDTFQAPAALIDRLSQYKESSGKTYGSDFATLLKWAEKDGDARKPRRLKDEPAALVEKTPMPDDLRQKLDGMYKLPE